MLPPNPIPQKIAIATHPSLQSSHSKALEIGAFLKKINGCEVFIAPLQDQALRTRAAAHEFDLLIAVGGDGTMLRASHICGPAGLPLLGINLGRLGFLTELSADHWQSAIQNQLLQGQYRFEKRMMLHAEHWRQNEKLAEWEVLNDVVLVRGRFVRPIGLEVKVDCCPVVTYNADGLIVSTATGSTAYALAVGGPIMPPELRNLMVIPISPHFSIDRAIILSEGDSITITLSTTHEAVISADGKTSVMIETGDELRAGASKYSVNFIRFSQPVAFYQNLSRYMEKNPAVQVPDHS